MSKAFDSLNRNILINDLKDIINIDELHLIKILLEVKLAVKCGNHTTEFFNSDTGAPQGDCASANQFTFYLAKSLQNIDNQTSLYEYGYHQISHEKQPLPDQMLVHNYSITTQKNQIDIDLQYADDISKITSNYSSIQKLHYELPTTLIKRDLQINTTKTENFHISRKNCDHLWKKCKYLGTILNTENDLVRRKTLAITAANSLTHIFQSKNISRNTKVTAFNTYISSIFLYNCEVWTLKQQHQQQIDSFHRHLLRKYVLNIKWPQTVTNTDVYDLTKSQQ